MLLRPPPSLRLLAILLGLAVLALTTIPQIAGHEDDLRVGEEDDYETDEGEDDEDDDGLLWDDEDLDEEWNTPNVTADELSILSDIADYLSNVQLLLSDVQSVKDREVAEGALEEAFTAVKQDVVAAVVAVALLPGAGMKLLECIKQEEEGARLALIDLKKELEQCYRQEFVPLDPPSAQPEGGGAEEEEERTAKEEEEDTTREATEREAAALLTLALGTLRAAPLLGAPEVAELMEAPPHRASLEQHALMLQRRERRRRAGVQRCFDLRREEAYHRADAARDGIASCLVQLQHPSHDEM